MNLAAGSNLGGRSIYQIKSAALGVNVASLLGEWQIIKSTYLIRLMHEPHQIGESFPAAPHIAESSAPKRADTDPAQ
jgi:hypothetical protein